MDDTQRMMHPQHMVGHITYGMQPHEGGQAPPHEGDVVVRKHDISEILQQIMNITDQSLDEAQARWVAVKWIKREFENKKPENTRVIFLHQLHLSLAGSTPSTAIEWSLLYLVSYAKLKKKQVNETFLFLSPSSCLCLRFEYGLFSWPCSLETLHEQGTQNREPPRIYNPCIGAAMRILYIFGEHYFEYTMRINATCPISDLITMHRQHSVSFYFLNVIYLFYKDKNSAWTWSFIRIIQLIVTLFFK